MSFPIGNPRIGQMCTVITVMVLEVGMMLVMRVTQSWKQCHHGVPGRKGLNPVLWVFPKCSVQGVTASGWGGVGGGGRGPDVDPHRRGNKYHRDDKAFHLGVAILLHFFFWMLFFLNTVRVLPGISRKINLPLLYFLDY